MNNLLTGSRIMADISREYSMMSLRLKQTAEGKVSPEDCAAQAQVSLQKIEDLKREWNVLCGYEG